jgi:hypothetical protein
MWGCIIYIDVYYGTVLEADIVTQTLELKGKSWAGI